MVFSVRRIHSAKVMRSQCSAFAWRLGSSRGICWDSRSKRHCACHRSSSTCGAKRGSGVEAPYLQLVLTRLWDEERRAGSHCLRLQTLERLGGADRIVRTHLDTALEALSPTAIKHLWVLHSGNDLAARSPLQLLDSAAMDKLLVALRNFADIVLIDAPPLLTSPDVAALVPMTDGVLFVADPSRVQRPMIEAARHEFEALIPR